MSSDASAIGAVALASGTVGAAVRLVGWPLASCNGVDGAGAASAATSMVEAMLALRLSAGGFWACPLSACVCGRITASVARGRAGWHLLKQHPTAFATGEGSGAGSLNLGLGKSARGNTEAVSTVCWT